METLLGGILCSKDVIVRCHVKNVSQFATTERLKRFLETFHNLLLHEDLKRFVDMLFISRVFK